MVSREFAARLSVMCHCFWGLLVKILQLHDGKVCVKVLAMEKRLPTTLQLSSER